MISKEKLNQIFEYKNGELYWKINPSDNFKIGTKAGYLTKDGYISVSYKRKAYMAHRVIFMMHNDFLPSVIDHIDGNRANNRIENLRPATKRQNCQNQKIKSVNTSGHKNVSWNKFVNKWKVGLKINGKYKQIGQYYDLELASLVATEARNKYFGEFARHE